MTILVQAGLRTSIISIPTCLKGHEQRIQDKEDTVGSGIALQFIIVAIICCTLCMELQLEGNTDRRYKLHRRTCMMLSRCVRFLVWTSHPSPEHTALGQFPTQRHRCTALSLSRYHRGNTELIYKQTIRNKVCTVTVDDCSMYECDHKRQFLRQKLLKEEDEECDEESKRHPDDGGSSERHHIKTYSIWMAKQHVVIFFLPVQWVCTKTGTWGVLLWLIFTIQYKYMSGT